MNKHLEPYRKANAPLIKLPQKCRDLIEIKSISKDGIFCFAPNKYSKSYVIEDINYAMGTLEQQKDTLQLYCHFLTSMEVPYKITYINSVRNTEEYINEHLFQMEQDKFDEMRDEMNEVIKDGMNKKAQAIFLRKILTIVIPRNNIDDARSYIKIIENNMNKYFRAMESSLKPMNANDRLELLRDLYNPDKMELNAWKSINFEEMSTRLADFKNEIMPANIWFHDSSKNKKHYISFNSDKKVGCCYYIRPNGYPNSLSDEVMKKIMDLTAEMVVSIDICPIPKQVALKAFQSIYMGVENDIIRQQRTRNKNGDFSTQISYSKRQEQTSLETILEDVGMNDENVNYLGFTILLYANDLEDLKKKESALEVIVKGEQLMLEKHDLRLREAFNTCLPIGCRQINTLRLLTTQSTAAVFPFYAKTINDKDGNYYGINQLTDDALFINRKNLMNGNGAVLATSGGGKSQSVKQQIEDIFLRFPDDDIIVIDPQNEYCPFINALDGTYIDLSPSTKNHINPFEVHLLDVNKTPFDIAALKTEFTLGLCENGSGELLTGRHKSIVSRCLIKMYEKSFNKNGILIRQPTLKDFFDILDEQPESEAHDLMLDLELFVEGSLNIFAHDSNVNMDNRVMGFGMSDLGNELSAIGILIMLENIEHRIRLNQKSGKATWVFIDEFHVLAKKKYSMEYLVKLWKEVRKMGGLLTGITQNITDLLGDDEIIKILGNSEFVMMLHQKDTDIEVINDKLGVSLDQLDYCKKALPGQGIIKNGNSIVAFDNNLSESSRLYKRHNTDFHSVQ